MDCFKVKVPDGKTLRGHTATGQMVPVHPGEYLVHRLRPKGDARAPAILRLVGADALGRDVHVRWDAIHALGLEVEDAADADDVARPCQRHAAGNDDSFDPGREDRAALKA